MRKKIDVVILALPLTKQTYHLMDGVILSSLKNEAILINLSRGGIVDTEALLDVLDQRHDLTAVLDVFETEPLPSGHPLWSMPNVKITPHNSFVGEENAARLWTLIRENLVSYS